MTNLIEFKAPFMRYKCVDHVLCWPKISMGFIFIRFSWVPVIHETYSLGFEVTEEAMNNLYDNATLANNFRTTRG